MSTMAAAAVVQHSTQMAALVSRCPGRNHLCSLGGSRKISRTFVSTSRTTTVIPTSGIEIENAVKEVDYVGTDSSGNNGNDGNFNDGGGSGRGRGGDGDGKNGWGGGSEDWGHSPRFFGILTLWDAFIRGWRARVRTDPQFPFKVLTEEIIGVGACVLGDMASRPNFGLDELDFVFSTVVVGSILNFTLMYMLAPTSAGVEVSRLPHVFASCPPGHMFEPGAYTLFDRAGTFVYKGLLFAGVGFVAGLVGTAISTMLLKARKKMDPEFVLQNKPPPTLLNAVTWAIHMGISSNLRYQAINGLEQLAVGFMSPSVFMVSVFGIRAANNVLGGTSFVMLARLTGSQKSQCSKDPKDSPCKHPKTGSLQVDDMQTTP